MNNLYKHGKHAKHFVQKVFFPNKPTETDICTDICNVIQCNTRLTTTIPTADEERAYFSQIFNQETIDFYKQYGYNLYFPSHEAFDELRKQNPDVTKIDQKKAKEAFYAEYTREIAYYQKMQQEANKHIHAINTKLQTLQNIFGTKDRFVFFPTYTIRLTRFGPGGFYKSHNGEIITKNVFMSGPYGFAESMIHEIVHIGIQKNIVQKYNLSHAEKEMLVDWICHTCGFYNRFQKLGDNNLRAYLDAHCSYDQLPNLPNVIAAYKSGAVMKNQGVVVK